MMLNVRNGTPSSRTPSPPVLAQRPRLPAPDKRRPCVRARSQTSLSRLPSSTPPGSRRPRSPIESPEARSPVSWSHQLDPAKFVTPPSRFQRELQACCHDEQECLKAVSLAKSHSSPCLVIAGLHEQHSKEQEKLIANRSLLSDAFGVFNRSNQSVPRVVGHHNSNSNPVLLGSAIRPSVDSEKFSKKQYPATSGKSDRGDVSPSVVCDVVRSTPRDSEKTEQKRRKALDAKLLRDLSVWA